MSDLSGLSDNERTDQSSSDENEYEEVEQRGSDSSDTSDNEYDELEGTGPLPQAQDSVPDLSMISLCSVHKAGSMTKECKVCVKNLTFIKDADTVEKLLGNPIPSSDVLARYGSRCDEIVPTLDLSPAILKLAKEVMTKGVFRKKDTLKDLIKDHLTLRREDHDSLCEDIRAEDVFTKFQKTKQFKTLFKYVGELKETLQTTRIAQRPIFKAVQIINDLLSEFRVLGEQHGVQFPEESPPRAGSDVPRGGRKLLDHLQVKSGVNVFKRPDLAEFIGEAGLDQALAEKLADLFENHREKAARQYIDLFQTASSSLSKIDDMMIFYLDLYSHCDGLLRDLLRDRLASIFKIDVKADIIRASSHKTLSKKKEPAKGLLGGN